MGRWGLFLDFFLGEGNHGEDRLLDHTMAIPIAISCSLLSCHKKNDQSNKQKGGISSASARTDAYDTVMQMRYSSSLLHLGYSNVMGNFVHVLLVASIC